MLNLNLTHKCSYLFSYIELGLYHCRTGGCIRFWSLRGKAYRASFADVIYHVTTGDGIFHRILRRLAGAMAVT